jgi:hypothetical protein
MDVPPLPDAVDMTLNTYTSTVEFQSPFNSLETYESIIGYTRGFPDLFYYDEIGLNIIHVMMLLIAIFVAVRFIVMQASNEEG